MKKLISFLAVVLLASCGTDTNTISQPIVSSQLAADNYVFEKKEYIATSINIELVEHSSYDHLLRSYYAIPGVDKIKEDRTLMAYSQLKFQGDILVGCTVHIIDPTIDYKPEYIGHELAHCLYGGFHPNQ